MVLSWKDFAVFGLGVAAGLFIAKQYAKAQVNNEIDKGLNAIGLGSLSPVVQGLVTPAVVS